jgi:hypothetical protein
MARRSISKLLVLSVSLLVNNVILYAQLTIGSNTHWNSDNSTYVVLDNLGMQYNGSTISPGNIFKFSGNSDVHLGGTIVPAYYVIVLARNDPGRFILLNNINISQSINFQGGLLDLNNNNVMLAASAIVNNENANSRFIGVNGGQVSITVNLNAPVSANPGNLGAIISSPANLGSVTINRGHQPQTNSSAGGNSISRYYDILPANNNNLNATLRLHYFDGELNGLDENRLKMWKSNDNLNWTNIGASSLSAADNYVEKTAIANFSRWALFSTGNPLPVAGLKLVGRWQNNTPELNWTTLSEYDNDHFDIERKYSTDPDFNMIVAIPGKHADGNSQSPTAYEYADVTATGAAGIILYRLKQVDKNGQYHYSNTIAIRPDAKKEFIVTVYPTTAVNNTIFIQAGNLNIQKMRVQVFDMNGRLMTDKELAYRSQLLPLPALSGGMYRLVVRSGEWVYNRLFTK